MILLLTRVKIFKHGNHTACILLVSFLGREKNDDEESRNL